MARKSKLEKIADIEKQMNELETYKKQLESQQREEERKRRTSRLCERGGFIESVLPETVGLTKEQFQDFVKRTLVTEYARRELTKLFPTAPEASTSNDDEKPQGIAVQGVANAEKQNEQAKK